MPFFFFVVYKLYYLIYINKLTQKQIKESNSNRDVDKMENRSMNSLNFTNKNVSLIIN